MAWIHKETGLLRREISRPKGADWDANYWQPLYTTPPAAQRPWVGLTDEDVNKESTIIASNKKLVFHAGMYVAQQILKERNT